MLGLWEEAENGLEILRATGGLFRGRSEKVLLWDTNSLSASAIASSSLLQCVLDAELLEQFVQLASVIGCRRSAADPTLTRTITAELP
jgi:hypothetical protein